MKERPLLSSSLFPIRRGEAIVALMAVVLGCWQPTWGSVFRRGDVDRDGRVNLTDAIELLDTLFTERPWFTCTDAADANDDGRLNLGDAVKIIRFLFAGDAMPPPGAFFAGRDPTRDDLNCEDATPAVLISEILYNPRDVAENREFIELYNRTDEDVDISGYAFTRGISYTMPPDTIIEKNGFIVIAKDPTASSFASVSVPLLGPYDGALSDGGENLTWRDAGGAIIESFEYDDRPLWPVSADGRGASLERIDYFAAAGDPHTWRGHPRRRTTPGKENEAFGTPTHPLLIDSSHSPPNPRSDDEVTLSLVLSVLPEEIASARVQWESVNTAATLGVPQETSIRAGPADDSVLEVVLPPQASQNLVRYNLAVTLADGTELTFPDRTEINPFLHYFVYDHEIPHRMPLVWLFARHRSNLALAFPSGAVILEVDSQTPLVFGRAEVSPRGQDVVDGFKIKFQKGREYRDDRTLNILGENGSGGTGGMGPFMEHFGFTICRELGLVAPRPEWFRVISFRSIPAEHTQNVVFQQVNERFFGMNGLSNDADIYKFESCCGLQKQNNLSTGTSRIDAFFNGIGSVALRRETILSQLDVDNYLLYSAVVVLISHWDSFHNNHFFYDDPTRSPNFKIVPWDIDQAFQEGCASLPVDRPLSGAGCESRPPGDLATAFHSQTDLHASYRDLLRSFVETGGPFNSDDLFSRIDDLEQFLLEDLMLQEEYLSTTRTDRRSQINETYASFKRFIEARIPFLLSELDSTTP